MFNLIKQYTNSIKNIANICKKKVLGASDLPVDNFENASLRITKSSSEIEQEKHEKRDAKSLPEFTRKVPSLIPKIAQNSQNNDGTEEESLLKILCDSIIDSTDDYSRTDWINSSYLSESMKVSSHYLRTLISRTAKKYRIQCDKKYVGTLVFRRFILPNCFYAKFDIKSTRKVMRCAPRARNGGGFNIKNIKYNNIKILKNINIKTTTQAGGRARNASRSRQKSAETQPPLPEKKIKLPPAWRRVDLSPLAEIGFSAETLSRIKKFSTPEIMQSSIMHFAYSLKHCQKVKKYADPLDVLIGVLRKGEAWHEPKFIAAKIAEQKRAEKLIARQEQRKAAEREELIACRIAAEFSNWRVTLTDEDLTHILPNTLPGGNLKKAATTSFLKNYYREKILIPSLTEEKK